MRWILLVVAACCLLVTGCDVKDATSLKLDLDHLNWQTLALIGLAYLMNSKGQFAALAGMVKSLLQGLKILPSPDSGEALTADQVAKLLADLYTQFAGHPDLQQGVLDLMKSHAMPVPNPTSTDLNATATQARKSLS